MNRAFISFVLAAGCLRAPEVVLIDRKTALEQLATGSYRKLDDELANAATMARPSPLTHEELENAGATTSLADNARVVGDSAELDDLLHRRCVGEANDGTIVVTANTCAGRVDESERNRLIERVNRDRFQIWRELQSRGAPKGHEHPLEDVRKAWHDAHLRGVECGGQVQRSDGKWEPKTC